MEIELKNGEKITLEVTSLFLEYVSDYEGGIEQLQKDAKSKDKMMYATNQLVYSIIASNYDEELTYRQAIRLVKLEDIRKITQFISDSLSNNELEKDIFSKKTKHRI